jgi:hypothetical protein
MSSREQRTGSLQGLAMVIARRLQQIRRNVTHKGEQVSPEELAHHLNWCRRQLQSCVSQPRLDALTRIPVRASDVHALAE